MGRIKVLPPEIRGKIAAGEVISRPASVIKELVENSLDAEAQHIDIEIEDGGKHKCLVNDDGIGMNREDALLAIVRYATSKITLIDDIDNIKTYGFRGEALASIAQVAHLELETSDAQQGTKIEIVGSAIKGVFDSHRSRGTKVRVANLFFNFPARYRFLKSADWERRLIIDVIKTYAYIAPQVTLSLTESGRSLLNFLSVDSVKKRIAMSLPHSITDYLIEIGTDIGSITISGFISRPDFFERHHFNYIYVNGRPVRYPRIYRRIIESYQNPKNPPAFLLNIIVEPKFVDINIHPTKNEVKFKDEQYILDLLMQTIKNNVFSKIMVAEYQTSGADQNMAAQSYIHDSVKNKPNSIQTTFLETTDKKITFVPGRDTDEFWQLHDTYILAQTKSGLIIVDQHVAHERIIYESIMKGRPGIQRLLFPITLELTPEEYRTYKNTKAIMKELGVEFKEFSARTIIIDSLPAHVQINREEISSLFSEINGLGNLMKEKGEIAKIIACRTAIKAGQKLSASEMQNLIDRLFACENPYTCPHGRPIVLKFTLEDLANRFGRI